MKYLLVLVAALSLTACGGGSGGNGSGAAGLKHNELADLFVQKLNASGTYDVTLAKASTGQYGYVVVLDRATNDYNAYSIEGYTPDQDASVFVKNHGGGFFDLDYIPSHYESIWATSYDAYCACYVTGYESVFVGVTYRDRSSGLIFEKTQGTPKDRLKIAALQESLNVERMRDTLVANYGLSAERGQQVAKLTYVWQMTPKERMTDADHDRFALEILGHSITEFKAAGQKLSNGDRSDLNHLIEGSAQVNGITTEQANEIVNGLIP